LLQFKLIFSVPYCDILGFPGPGVHWCAGFYTQTKSKWCKPYKSL